MAEIADSTSRIESPDIQQPGYRQPQDLNRTLQDSMRQSADPNVWSKQPGDLNTNNVDTAGTTDLYKDSTMPSELAHIFNGGNQPKLQLKDVGEVFQDVSKVLSDVSGLIGTGTNGAADKQQAKSTFEFADSALKLADAFLQDFIDQCRNDGSQTPGGTTTGNVGNDKGTTTGNAGSDGGTTTGNTGSDGGTTTGNIGSDGGTTTGNTGSDGGTTTGNIGSDGGTTTGNIGSDGGTTTGKPGSDGGTTTGNVGNDKGTTTGNTGSDGGTTTGNTGSDGGTTTGNTGSDGGTTTGNTGSDGGTTTGNTGSDGGTTTGNTGSDGGTTTGNTGSDGGTTTGNTGSDGGTTDKRPVTGQPASPGDWIQQSINGMKYDVLLPANYDASKQYPTLLYLHQLDMGTDEPDLKKEVDPWFNSSQFRSEYPAIVVMPLLDQSADPSGQTVNFGGVTPGDQPGQDNAIAALKQVMSQYSSDPSRVYVTGNSLGGIGSWDMMAKYNAQTGTDGKIFAAGMPLAGADYALGYSNPDPAVVQELQNVPIWAIHGSQDTSVPLGWDQAMASALANNPNFHYTEVPGDGHDVWDDHYGLPEGQQYWSWMFSQQSSVTA